MSSMIAVVGLFVFGCLGLGGLILRHWREALPGFPPATQFAIAYFLGQGIITVVLFALALVGLLYPAVSLVLLTAAAVPVPGLLWQTRGDSLRGIGQGLVSFWRAPFGWKLLALLAAGLYLYGFATIGATMAGDAAAFYLAIAKTTAYAHQLVALPGYDGFTGVVGLYAEVLLAALIGLGLPVDLARAVSWVNYLPTLVLFWGLGRAAGMCGRGRLLLLCVALSSSAALLLWGGGKTDLYAVGPALAACLFALASWAPRTRTGAALLAGLFTGLAVGFKFSLLLVLPASVLLIVAWQDLFALVRDKGRGPTVVMIVRRGLLILVLFGLGLVAMVLPHLLKNWWMSGSLLGFSRQAADYHYYSLETTRRLVLTYPFALTFGRYWGQYGNLSPLVIAFLPLLLFLPRPRSWRTSGITALTVGTLVGLALWVAVMPAVFMPRYILGSLLLLGIPAAAAGAWFSRQGVMPGAAILMAAALTLICTPAHVNSWESIFDWAATRVRLTDHRNECLSAGAMYPYCQAHQAINRAVTDSPPARQRNRVLVFSWYRLWLRPELLLSANTDTEFADIEKAEDPWALVKRRGFGYAFLDQEHPYTRVLAERMPPPGSVRELYRVDTLSAYEILP